MPASRRTRKNGTALNTANDNAGRVAAAVAPPAPLTPLAAALGTAGRSSRPRTRRAPSRATPCRFIASHAASMVSERDASLIHTPAKRGSKSSASSVLPHSSLALSSAPSTGVPDGAASNRGPRASHHSSAPPSATLMWTMPAVPATYSPASSRPATTSSSSHAVALCRAARRLPQLLSSPYFRSWSASSAAANARCAGDGSASAARPWSTEAASAARPARDEAEESRLFRAVLSRRPRPSRRPVAWSA
mmetsp:Transcript_15230/g.44848  ORF Transcript_15230/g.44848 Transcript_15230/m.44848 type:complete len:249 (+) Transcript_15230:1261-2007(+)